MTGTIRGRRDSTADVATARHWYDLTCPFCYVAQSRNAIIAANGFTLVQLPFRAHPEVPDGGLEVGPRRGPTYELLAAEATEAGLELHWPPRLPGSLRALAAAEWVRTHNPAAFPQLVAELFAAHFARGEDIGSQQIIDARAAAAGVDTAALHVALGNGQAYGAVTASEREGRRMGVTGTPAWLVGGQLITGLRERDLFQRLRSAGQVANLG
jgi:predicted DsbA family dithiol-disulfide isomerase